MVDAEPKSGMPKMAALNSLEEIEAEDKKVVIKHKSKKLEGRGDEVGEQLLPGIPDEITIDQVAPKLPWTAFHVLSSVSRGWQQAIRNHEVYDARVRSQSTNALVVMNHQTGKGIDAIALYSLSDGSSYHLPPIPGISRGLPYASQCISLDGKLYVLGGFNESRDTAIAEVYVLDLAGQTHWEQCTNMEDARGDFGCGVINGKIYVFGGTAGFEPVCGSEVYDPESDVWSPITPMKSFRFSQKVTAMGEELFVHDGEVYDSDFFDGLHNYDDDSTVSDHIQAPSSAEVYHPLKNQWKIVDEFAESDISYPLLMVGGKIIRLTPLGTDVYDSSANSWKPSQSMSLVFGPSGSSIDRPIDVVAVDNEFLGIMRWKDFTEGTKGTCLMRTTGLGCENKAIVWQEMKCSLSLVDVEFPFLCPILL